MKQISALSVGLFSSVAPFVGGFKTAESATTGLLSKVESFGSKLVSLTGIAGVVSGAIGSMFEVGKGISFMADLETAGVQLKSLTGDVHLATDNLNSLKDFAANSPFAFPDLLEADKRLIAVGVDARTIPGLFRTIGDVAAGTGEPIGDLADVFTRVKETGGLATRDLKEFARSGIPIMGALSEEFHTSEKNVFAMVKAGKVGFPQLVTAFNLLDAPGGKFAGILDAQNHTIGGEFHTLQETIVDQLAGVSESVVNAFNLREIIPTFTGGLAQAGTAVAGWVTKAMPYIQGFERVTWMAFTGVWNAAKWAFTNVFNFVAPVARAVYQVIAQNWQAIVANTVSVWNAITGAVVAGWNALVSITNFGAIDNRNAFRLIGDGLNWLASTFTRIFQTISYSITNWKLTAALVCVGVALDFVTLGNEIAWVFTDVVWPAIKWAGGMFMDFAHYAESVFKNLGSNIVNVFKHLPGLIIGTTRWQDVWTPMLAGFEQNMRAFPAIAARQTGPIEQSLINMQGRLQTQWANGLGKFFADSDAKSLGEASLITGAIKNAFDFKMPGSDAAGLPDSSALPSFDAANAASPALNSKGEEQVAKIIHSGSAEAMSMMFRNPVASMPGADSVRADMNKAAQQQQLDQAKSANLFLNKIELNTRPTNAVVVNI